MSHTMLPNQSPEPTPIALSSSAFAVDTFGGVGFQLFSLGNVSIF